jgi:RNA polymerase sigma factor (sigma-70 family)
MTHENQSHRAGIENGDSADDCVLLRRYAEEKSEAAFAVLVRRHLDLVYSVALRQVGGSTHLAEEVAQVVFAALARKAGALARRPVLGGWLYRTAQFTAVDVVRAESRRRARETEALHMQDQAMNGGGDVDWEKLRPVLDGAMAELREEDRDAVVLRFFEEKSFAELGARLRLSENAARMRVERALDRLHAALGRRGVTSTSAALAVALGGQAVMAAPAGLAGSVTGAALAGATVGGGVAGILTFMSMTKLQMGIAGAVVALGVGGAVVQSKSNAALRDELADLRRQGVGLDAGALAQENARLARAAAEVTALRGDDAELARLGDEAAALKRQMEATAKLAAQKARGGEATPIKGEILSAAQVDRQPKLTFRAQTTYPLELRKNAVEGQAVIEFVVDTQGKVRDAVAVSSTHPEFAAAAIEALNKSQFDPGQKGGESVNTRMKIPMVFSVGKRVPVVPSQTAGPAVPSALMKPWF